MIEAIFQMLPLTLAALIVLSASIYGFVKFETTWIKIALFVVGIAYSSFVYSL